MNDRPVNSVMLEVYVSEPEAEHINVLQDRIIATLKELGYASSRPGDSENERAMSFVGMKTNPSSDVVEARVSTNFAYDVIVVPTPEGREFVFSSEVERALKKVADDNR